MHTTNDFQLDSSKRLHDDALSLSTDFYTSYTFINSLTTTSLRRSAQLSSWQCHVAPETRLQGQGSKSDIWAKRHQWVSWLLRYPHHRSGSCQHPQKYPSTGYPELIYKDGHSSYDVLCKYACNQIPQKSWWLSTWNLINFGTQLHVGVFHIGLWGISKYSLSTSQTGTHIDEYPRSTGRSTQQ